MKETTSNRTTLDEANPSTDPRDAARSRSTSTPCTHPPRRPLPCLSLHRPFPPRSFTIPTRLVHHLAVRLFPLTASRFRPYPVQPPLVRFLGHRFEADPAPTALRLKQLSPVAVARPVLRLALAERRIRLAPVRHVFPAPLCPPQPRTPLAVFRIAVAVRDRFAALGTFAIVAFPPAFPVRLLATSPLPLPLAIHAAPRPGAPLADVRRAVQAQSLPTCRGSLRPPSRPPPRLPFRIPAPAPLTFPLPLPDYLLRAWRAVLRVFRPSLHRAAAPLALPVVDRFRRWLH